MRAKRLLRLGGEENGMSELLSEIVLPCLVIIGLLLCFVFFLLACISIWALVKPWVSPLIDAWSDWVKRRLS